MAFNFNWSPLAADASFYTRAQELLTAALNKSPKPPIIVDDILVNELNLGSVSPELEILEIGDLAEDRFRGIFKMRYCGDAFLTLRTRVQANPLNTFLSTRPSFASPDPLAAASGLTIPLKITLSEIKLSAFIILVFSRQKGVTLVFRNDPLESLKVSSTFDSIPFVRDYLQKEISGQLRTLLINEVPAIIHRLSLRLFVPEFRARGDEALALGADQPAATANATADAAEPVTDPLASPPQDPVDAHGHVLDAAQVAHLALDAAPEAQSLFSRKNLLRLAALRESNRTLSLFTPRLADVVYRAGPPAPAEPPLLGGGLRPGLRTLNSAAGLPRSHASTPSPSIFSATSDPGSASIARPPLTSFGSSFATARPGKPGRKRKHRVVNLRKKVDGDSDAPDSASVSGESLSATLSSAASASEDAPSGGWGSAPREGELVTPPSSPNVSPRAARRSPKRVDGWLGPDLTPWPPLSAPPVLPQDLYATPRPPTSQPNLASLPVREKPPVPSASHHQSQTQEKLQPDRTRDSSTGVKSSTVADAGPSRLAARATSPFLAAPFPYADSSPGGTLEQAWMMRMASEIARRVQEQKDAAAAGRAQGESESGFWEAARERDDAPPPAYRA